MQHNQKISECIKQWGNSASIALLDPNCKIFTHPSVEGMMGYNFKKNCAVVFGDPVCSAVDSFKLAEAFHDFCKTNSKNYIYLTASERFTEWAMKYGCHGLLEAEEELIIDPAAYPKSGSNGRLLHKKMNHAVNAEVVVKEYTHHDEKIRKTLLEAESIWLKKRKGPQLYLSHNNFFENGCGKRCFYAVQNDQIVGALLLNRLEAHKCWLLYLLMALPNAPGGTSEFLVMSALDKLAEEKCQFFSFGVSAAENLGDIVGLGKISEWVARTAFKVTKRVFNLDNRRNFWKKFQPTNKRSFVLFSKPRIGIDEIMAVLKSLNMSF